MFSSFNYDWSLNIKVGVQNYEIEADQEEVFVPDCGTGRGEVLDCLV